MKICTICFAEKSIDSFYVKRSGGLVPSCKACTLIAAKKYREEHREKFNAGVRAWRKKYPDRAIRTDREKRLKNPAKYREIDRLKKKRNPAIYAAIAKKSRKKNLHKILEKGRERYRKNRTSIAARNLIWVKNNRDKMRAAKARRRACEINAMPAWADKSMMRQIYADAKRLTAETGVKHHVDHIIPLNNPIVCGLHCQFNLQVIPAFENFSKGNRGWPGMPGEDVWEWVASAEFKDQWRHLCADIPKRERPPSAWASIPAAVRSKMSTDRNNAAWAKRSPADRAAIGDKISAALKRRNAVGVAA